MALPCADAAFQGWADRGAHGDIDPLDATRPGPAADLVADGFEPVGLFASGRAFGVIRAKQGRCYLALPDPGAGEIALRGPDGARLVPRAGGAIAWCSHAADGIFSLWRTETSGRAVSVVGSPADRAGGIMGSVLALRRHGARDVEIALLPDELAKDARAALVAATVPAASILEADTTGLPGRPESKIVGFSLRGRVAMLPEVAPAVPTGCVPDLDASGPRPRAASEPFAAYLCAEARGQVWHRGGDAQHQGAVEGARPYWLGVLDGAAEEGALRAAAAALVFAQRLSLLGYEPTTSEAREGHASTAPSSPAPPGRATWWPSGSRARARGSPRSPTARAGASRGRSGWCTSRWARPGCCAARRGSPTAPRIGASWSGGADRARAVPGEPTGPGRRSRTPCR